MMNMCNSFKLEVEEGYRHGIVEHGRGHEMECSVVTG